VTNTRPPDNHALYDCFAISPPLRTELMKLAKRRRWMLGALAAGGSIVTTIGLAIPAQAAQCPCVK
jgi:hypothetical protein